MRELFGEIVSKVVDTDRTLIWFQVGDDVMKLWVSLAEEHMLDVGSQWTLNVDAENTIHGGSLWRPARHLGAFGGREVIIP